MISHSVSLLILDVQLHILAGTETSRFQPGPPLAGLQWAYQVFSSPEIPCHNVEQIPGRRSLDDLSKSLFQSDSHSLRVEGIV